MTDINTVIEGLAALGNSPDEIAEALRKQGIKGVCEDPCMCALVVYVEREWPGGHPRVNSSLGYGWPIEERAWRVLPVAIQDFVAEFDEGEFPDLIEVES